MQDDKRCVVRLKRDAAGWVAGSRLRCVPRTVQTGTSAGILRVFEDEDGVLWPSGLVVVVGDGYTVQQTICGGITRDTLVDAYRVMEPYHPIKIVCNLCTIGTIDRRRANDGAEHAQRLLNDIVDVEGQGFHIVAGIPDNQVRMLGNDGMLYIFDFV